MTRDPFDGHPWVSRASAGVVSASTMVEPLHMSEQWPVDTTHAAAPIPTERRSGGWSLLFPTTHLHKPSQGRTISYGTGQLLMRFVTTKPLIRQHLMPEVVSLYAALRLSHTP